MFQSNAGSGGDFTVTGTLAQGDTFGDSDASVGLNRGSFEDFDENGPFELASTSPETPSVEALEFNGVDNWLHSTSAIPASYNFTISFWINPIDISMPISWVGTDKLCSS